MTTYTQKLREKKIETDDYVGRVEVWRSERGGYGVRKVIEENNDVIIGPIRIASFRPKIKSSWWGRPHETWYADEIAGVVDDVMASAKRDIERFQADDAVIEDEL